MKDVLSVFNFEVHSPNIANNGTWLHAVNNKRSLLSLLENLMLKVGYDILASYNVNNF